MNATELEKKPLDTAIMPTDGFEMGVLLRAAYFSLRRCGNTQFGPHDANGDQFVLLTLLADGGPLNQLELVKRGGYDPSTTTNMLKLLETRRFISREQDPNDGRAKIVHLTAEGKAQHKKLWKTSLAVRQQLWDCVKPEDRQVVNETLQRIAQTMDASPHHYGATLID